MRTIPASILNKLKLLQQTKANNADPRINLVMQRTRRYIEQGSTLNPVTLWDRSGLGSIDIAYRRESRMTAPDKVYVVYIENGEAHVARTDYIKSIEQANEWEYLYSLGSAVDCAIEFDGRWERSSKDAEVCFDAPAQWTHVTMGDPYIFRVLPDGSLVVQQGQGEPVELVPSGVTKVAALRGWKNVYRWDLDHGLICAYIREGAVYYRNYANQGTEQNPQPPVWEQERLVDTLPTPAQNVALFRTNDYRVGFLCESNGEIHWTVTDRNWAGMAIRDHTVRARGTGLYVAFLNVVYEQGYNPDHFIVATGEIDVVALLWAMPENSFKSAENDGPTTIHAVCEHFLTDLTAADFVVIDEDEAVFSVSNIVAGATPFDITLTVDNLNYANQSLLGEGDLTLKFLGSGTTKGEAGQDVDPFEITFTPEGLEFIALDPPEVEAIWNE